MGQLGAGPVVLEAIPNPFKSEEIVTVRGPEGATIADLLEAAGIRWRRYGGGACWIEDAARRLEPVAIPRALWHRVKPKAGTVTTVKLMPGRGGGGKSILSVILSLAVAAVAFFAAPLIAGPLATALQLSAGATQALTGLIAAGINIVGNLIIGALIPPPQPRAPAEVAASLNDREGFTIQGTANRARPYQKIPLQLGRLRRWPDLAAEFVTEPRGNDVYLRFLMTLGWGPLKAEDWKIGETPIAEFEGIRFNYREGWPDDPPPEIYTADFHTEGFAIELPRPQMAVDPGWQTRVTLEGTDEFQVEIAFPAGLFQLGLDDAAGQMFARTATFAAEMAPAGTENWAAIAWFNVNDPGFEEPGVVTVTDRTRTGQPRRVGRVIPDNAGNPTKQWRVRLKRTNEATSAPHAADQAVWTALKSVKHSAVLPLLGKVAWIEGEIKASGQLNGTLQELNCIATSYVRAIDAAGFVGAWAVPRTNWVLSRNPAELYAHAATHPYALPKKIGDARLDFGGLDAWKADAAQIWTHGKPRFRFDRVYETGSTLARVLDEIAATGRARRGIVGGKHGVVRDVPQAAVKQHYTPRNSSGYRIEIPFRRRLHGVRVRYNKDGLGQEAEITVYDDGYSADGSVPGTVAATELETAEAIGQTDAELVWALWRYHLAVQKLRPHTHEFSTGVENLKSGRGALVRLTHDVPGFGLAHGRTKSAAVDGGGDFTGVVLDTPVTMEPGKSYGVRLRTHAGSFYTTVVNVAISSPVVTSSLTFSVPQPASWALNALIDAGTGEREQDVFGFGEADKESAEMLVLGVVPGANLSAKLTLVDAAPGVHDADLGAIPTFDPQITLPPAGAREPAPPVIRSIRSDESVMVLRVGGVLAVRFLAEFNPPQGLPVPDFIQARWRASEASPWTVGTLQPAASLAYSGEGVAQGVAYTIEFRYVTAAGRPSDWAAQQHTIVGKTTPPPDVPTLFLTEGHIVWPYPSPPVDVVHGGGFRIKYQYGQVTATPATWSAAIAAHDDLLADPRFPRSLLPPGTLTIMVKAVDADGNESAQAAVLVSDVGGAPLDNVVERFDYKAAGWPGAVSGGTVVGGNLEASALGAFYTPAGAPLYQAGRAFYGDQFSPLVYSFSATPPENALPARLTLEPAIAGANQRIDLWVNDGEPLYAAGEPLYEAGTPFYGSGAWRGWPGSLEVEARVQTDLRIQAGGGASQAVISALTASFDVPDIEETFEDVTIGAGGTRLPISETYRAIKAVIATLQDDGGAARTLRVADKDPALGPLVKVFDAAGAGTSGLIDARIQGY